MTRKATRRRPPSLRRLTARILPASVRRWLLLAGSIRVVVDGDSMWPTLAAGDRILVNRLAYRLTAPRRGDIVLLRDPGRPGFECIKRIVALPDERIRIEGAGVWVNGVRLDEPYRFAAPFESSASFEWRLPRDAYFVLGDNRDHSRDSRRFGPIRRRALRGRYWHRYARGTGQ